MIAIGIAPCCLLAVGTAGWYRGAAEAALVCCVLAAAGALWLGRGRAKLVGAIVAMTKQLKEKRPVRIKQANCKILNELFEVVSGRIESVDELEERLKELQIQIQLAQKQKINTEAIIYSIRDAVLVVDEFDKLLMANEAAEKLFGFALETSKHKSISELIGKDKNEFTEILCHCKHSKVRATKREMEFFVDGEPKTFDCIFSCVRERDEQICRVVAVLRDITREKEISQMKNDFVSHVSHELKTPLASITAYSEMLMDGEADDEQTRKEFYLVIQNQAQRLNRLIEDILNISRIESGLIKVEKQAVSLPILIEEQLQMIKSYADEKNIEIIRPQGNGVIVFGQVYVDKDMISQVIINLLSNAVKYTQPGGSIKIETEVDETASLARVSITDTGVGIPEDEVGHVFEKFYRVGANKKCAKGTGLGLNLVKQIVEKVHEGRVFVTSQVGLGSTFGFELFLATANMVETNG